MRPRGSFFGDSVRSCRVGSATVLEKRHPAEEVLADHHHERAYLSYVVHGGYRERSPAGSVECGPGTLVVHPPGESHEDLFHDRPSTLVAVEPSERFLAHPGGRAFERRSVLTGPVPRRLVGTIRRELAAADDLSELVIQGALLELAAEVLREARTAGGRRPPTWLREARNRAAACFRDGVGLGDLAAEVGVHPSHLARELRRHFDTSVGELVRTARIEHALARLPGTTTLADLAADCGYADQSHFTRSFTRAVVMSPGAYRRAVRGATG